MTMHKDELYEIRHQAKTLVDAKPQTRKKKDKAQRTADSIEHCNRALLQQNQSTIAQQNEALVLGKRPTKGLKGSTALVHPKSQWQSHRRRGPATQQSRDHEVEAEWSLSAPVAAGAPAIAVPRLDFSKLTEATGLPSREQQDESTTNSTSLVSQAVAASKRRLAMTKLRQKAS